MAKAVLFDLDGTLLDTAPDLVKATNQVLRAIGEPECDYDYVSHFASHGAIGLLKRALGERLDHYNVTELRQLLLDFYQADIASGSKLFDGIEPLLQSLDSQNVPWGIVTNKPAFLTDALLPHFNQFNRCQVAISGDTCGVAKPDPLPMTTAAQALNIAPEDILYVGDAERDMQAGNKVAMTTLLALWGYIDEHDQPDQWQANGQLSHPLEILDWLK
ncbi:HAD-IA family hydrolase [Neiella marina]|uniref:HAD-IA family hydrolase n=1 Tax=Neiella holothuriorum TaxID=2870530 RepID=A0ABS7ECP3_9GAMM|nr:HAD-IA family hydrolase [Neiella holothuriorum]MBW8190107.1 HAD-IA family hydrolase [Neiella holothuriorum]